MLTPRLAERRAKLARSLSLVDMQVDRCGRQRRVAQHSQCGMPDGHRYAGGCTESSNRYDLHANRDHTNKETDMPNESDESGQPGNANVPVYSAQIQRYGEGVVRPTLTGSSGRETTARARCTVLRGLI